VNSCSIFGPYAKSIRKLGNYRVNLRHGVSRVNIVIAAPVRACPGRSRLSPPQISLP
jgi:hypothetical protein